MCIGLRQGERVVRRSLGREVRGLLLVFGTVEPVDEVLHLFVERVGAPSVGGDEDADEEDCQTDLYHREPPLSCSISIVDGYEPSRIF